jgi:hypothetical protein
MQTSYFAKAKNLYPTSVSIALQTPEWFTGKRYTALNPTPFILSFKDRPKEFEKYYRDLILKRLNPFTVYKDLGANSILLCWEKAGKFCHRRIVASWLEKELDIVIPEKEYVQVIPMKQVNLFEEEE